MRQQRIEEIDFARGTAIILMVIFHIIFDLTEYYSFPFNYLSGFWFYTGKAAAILFILVCGISSTVSTRSFRHGLTILGWGMVLTAITYFSHPQQYIRFGILHLLGFSLLSCPLIHQLRPLQAAACGLAVILTGSLIKKIAVAADYGLIFGLPGPLFSSLDYYPLFPWYGIFLLGTAAGRLLYPDKKSLLPAQFRLANPVNRLGRHSLLIYLVHQPVILAGLFILDMLIGIKPAN